MPLSAPPIDPTRCPLCGQPNRCAQQARPAGAPAAPHCWCMERRVAPDALARVPAQARGRACLCPACATPRA
ncbi:MAG: cysteine-rich CWC family protein [Rubrivivax sp.]|nr:cysteine-rich CWC family protein [Rubrivivax sp.]HNE59838.1 cysteine-rich CWC family protein [Ottowia sp.]HNO42317.1 cysteine-rich CWC family protein [Ottowia sp.]HOZ94203.1 cysteine-rich CWC family protein [Ottowia sp.]HQO53680.1 cysteine-rich CWC family protein [Ottowia sp.]